MSGKAVVIGLSDQSITTIAAVCHAANAAYCRSLGDDSQPAWSAAPEWQVSSAINGVEFHLANPDADDAASHENWLKAKEADGWKYGEVKDETKKEHPCMVPFGELPPEQQFKDALFRSIVHGAAPLLAGHDAEADGLKRQLAGQKGQVTKARRALEATLPAKPRKFAAVEQLLAPGDLLELIAEADRVELAFVGPKGLELAGVAPRIIEGGPAAWRVATNGLRLEVPTLPLDGRAPGQPPIELAGYVLLLDGEPAAAARRMDVLTIGANSHHELKDDVIF